MIRCARCPRTAPDEQHLCLVHASELLGWLTELPRQAQLLRQFLSPSGGPARGRSGGRAHAPIPVDLRVLTLLGPGHLDPPPGTPAEDDVPILARLGGWAGYIAYTYPALGWHPARDPTATLYVGACEQALPRHGPTIAGWCAWLTAYLPYALTQPWIGDLHRQLGDLIARIRDLTHAVPHKHPQGAPCPDCQAFALVAIDGQWGIVCEACGHHLTPEAYAEHRTDFLQAHQAATDT